MLIEIRFAMEPRPYRCQSLSTTGSYRAKLVQPQGIAADLMVLPICFQVTMAATGKGWAR